MCLVLGKTSKELLAKFGNKKQEAIFWRVYYKYPGSSLLYSPYFSHRYGGKITNFGVVKSDRTEKEIAPCEITEKKIEQGIHVFTKKEQAKSYAWLDETIVPVTCRLKDFVAEGENEQAVFTKIRIRSAIFTKIRIRSKDWKKIFKKI